MGVTVTVSLRKSVALALLAIVMSGGSALAQEATPSPASTRTATPVASEAGTSLRGSRYCELLVPTRDASSSSFTLRVYNTQGLNDCPETAWNAIDARAEARRLGVPLVIKNGPRYLAYDRITAEIDGSVETFGDLEARIVATLVISSGTTPQDAPAYSGMTVDRTTEYIFLAGQPVFQLTAPDGSVYVMQTYLAENDPAGDFSGLHNLADRLTLPEGWAFRVVVPEQDLHAATIDGRATVLRDDLGNTYQLLSRGNGTPIPAS